MKWRIGECPRLFVFVEGSYYKKRREDESIFAEYFDVPGKVKPEDLRSNAGFLVDKYYKDSSPYKFKKVPKQLYASSVFNGSPAIGPMKVYPVMNKWIKDNGYEVCGPCLEIYKMQGKKMSTQYLMPIKKKKS